MIGVLRRQDIIEAYETAIANRKEISTRLRELRETHEGKVQVLELNIPRDHYLAGHSIKAISQTLPDECILVSIRRGNNVIIPHGDTQLKPGDQLIALASLKCEAAVKNIFQPRGNDDPG